MDLTITQTTEHNGTDGSQNSTAWLRQAGQWRRMETSHFHGLQRVGSHKTRHRNLGSHRSHVDQQNLYANLEQ